MAEVDDKQPGRSEGVNLPEKDNDAPEKDSGVQSEFRNTTKRIEGDVFSFTSQAITKLKNLLNNPFWEKSFLLKHKKKKVEESVQRFEESMSDLEDRVANVDNIVEKKRKSHIIPEGDVLVYVTLYQASGKDLMMWQITCNAISTCGFGRPIYLDEEKARQWVKSKGAGNTDGYAVVHVPEVSLITKDKGESLMYDSLENQVVHIKPGNLSAERIVKFVHYNQDSYYFIDGKLVLAES